MKTGFTQSERISCYRRAAMYQVMEWLNWKEPDYAGFVYRMGLDFLKVVAPDEEDQRRIMATSQYWGWWKLQWYMREQEFLKACEEMHQLTCGKIVTPMGIVALAFVEGSLTGNRLAFTEGRQKEYRLLHDGTMLATKPEMEESYGRDLVRDLNQMK